MFADRRPDILAPAFLFSLAVVLIVVTAGCSSSSDPSGPAPSPNGNYVSANGAVQVGPKTATMMINIGTRPTTVLTASGRLQVGVNEFQNLAGDYRPESDHQVSLASTPGASLPAPYVFLGKLEGSTITGSLSGGNVSGTVAVTLAATSVPAEAVVLLGAWDYSHEVRVGTLANAVDPCPVPQEFLTIKDSCSDRYHVEIEGNMLPANSCGDSCLPDVDLATGTLEGTTLTLQIPEVGEPTSPANRLFSMNLPGCTVIWTGSVALDGTSGDTSLVNLVSECQGSGGSCDPYCTDGRLNAECIVSYELDLSRCEGECPCVN